MLCMLQCELPGAVHGGERRSKRGGGRKAGKHGEWREPAPPVRAVGASAGVETRGVCPDVQVLVLSWNGL